MKTEVAEVREESSRSPRRKVQEVQEVQDAAKVDEGEADALCHPESYQ